MKAIEKNKSKDCYLRSIIFITNSKQVDQKKKTQMITIRNKKEDITTVYADVKRI